MHFFGPNIDKKNDVVLMFFLMQFLWKTDAALMCLFGCVF